MLNPCSPDFVASLAARLPDILTAPEPRWLEEPRGKWPGQAGAVARPRSTAEVAEVVRACAAARVGIVPWGGGTGLVAGQVMGDGPLPLVLSLERMNRTRGVYPSENVMLVEAGMTLSEVHAAAEAVDRVFPLSLASQGTARIGGNLATNAGGVNVVRYGNARDLCLGLEVVMADGTIWDGLRRLRKDNTGYDLRGLMIGSEGTLGVITAASLRLFPRPRAEGAALLVVPGPAEALQLLALAQDQVGPGLSAFELISGQGLDFLAQTMPQIRQPFADRPDWMVLVDLGLTQDTEAALLTLYEAGAEAGLVLDGIIAQSSAQRAALWDLRETIPLANRAIGAISSHDISLPLSEIPGFIPAATAALQAVAPFRINCFGHLGDGNLHFNVFPPEGRKASEFKALSGEVQELVHQMTVDRGGSFSAEHGVGRLKVADVERWGEPAKLAAMRAIKAALDPLGIMNPGAVLRS
ncbi:FAD-binding oxidoreductase [Rhodobacter sp. KR11]|uniref:FAD-binding oxidoreductase n=1 Tax=Rhodobacter sp. KR11 TaxID=2974588 RepID=UPI002222F149|nr:FAD-binding oxidoreductase [Rhodobacter sp. KR11]MCW1920147.1 FAD-binding oxidoreductase [Rhodobacter sp. KR11]